MYVFPSGMFGRQITRLHTLHLQHTHSVSNPGFLFLSQLWRKADFLQSCETKLIRIVTCWYCTQQSKQCQLLNVGTQYSPSFPSSFLPFVGTQYYGETGHSEFKILATVKYTSHVLLNVFVVKHICC